MLQTYKVNGQELDSLDLKVLLITRGMNIPDEIPEHFGASHRVMPASHPQACNCFILPDEVVVHMVNTGPSSGFGMEVGDSGKACLTYHGECLTEVDFPPRTQFYEQNTSSGMPFARIGVLQGLDVLSFPYLWPCKFAQAGYPCQFCYPGGESARLAREGKDEPASPTPQDVAEVVNYCVNVEDCVWDVQIAGGSITDPRAECPLAAEMLRAIDQVAGLDNLEGEFYLYIGAPTEATAVDEVFEAGADRVAYDLNVWDEDLFRRVCPGTDRFTGRQKQLEALEYVAERYGPNKACSAFVVGIEPLESLLAGAEYVGARGIVPLASVWLPHGRPVLGSTEAPGADYYRRVRETFAEIYDKYDLEPPGRAGFNVCMCRDAWNHRRQILAGMRQ